MVRVLWGSPLPPTRSGVSDYAVETLPALAKRAKVRVLRPPGWQRPDSWPLADLIELVDPDTEPGRQEISLIHLGNNPYHEWLIPRLADPRTVVVLHDFVLHHLLVEATLVHDDWDTYLKEMRSVLGDRGDALVRARRFGCAGRRDPFLFPMNKAFLRDAEAVVVHSSWVRDKLEQAGIKIPIGTVALAAQDPSPLPRRSELRKRLGLEPGSLVLMHLGFLTAEKGVSDILVGLAAARRSGIPAHLVLVGEGRLQKATLEAVDDLGLTGSVTTTGWVDARDFPAVPAAADLGIVLRRPSAGETSAAVLRFLACGTPVAVSGLRQFLEWPEEAAPRITPGKSTAAEVARLLAVTAAAKKTGEWEQRRRFARAAYEQSHRPELAADALSKFLEGLEGIDNTC